MLFLADGTRDYAWDAENRLVGVATASGLSITMTYDGLGRRTSIKTVRPGKSTLFRYLVWCGTRICQMRNGGNSVLRGFYPEGEYLTSKAQGLYYGPDQLGSTRIVDDPAASAIYAYDYDPLGNPTSGPGNTAPRIKFRYADMYYDGLNLTQFRAYNPGTGRWISRDPLGEASDSAANLYHYAAGSPIVYRDPSGQWTVEAGFTLNIGGLQFGAGIALDGYGNVGRYFSHGVGSPGFSGGIGFGGSTAPTICGLAGPFVNYGEQPGPGPGLTGHAFFGHTPGGTPVIGAEVEWGAGTGGDYSISATTTTVTPMGQF